MGHATVRVALAVCLFIVLGVVVAPVAAQEPGTCIGAAEAELLTLVNEYRGENLLDPVPWSTSLITVGQWHGWDAVTNSPFTPTCNLHSWSDARPDLWIGGCYTPDHANAILMWYKPQEITGGVFAGIGFENAAVGYESPAEALTGWSQSPGHNAMILNLDIWSGYVWQSMGAGVDLEAQYYYLWFSTAADPQPLMSNCDPASVFADDFETGATDRWSQTQP